VTGIVIVDDHPVVREGLVAALRGRSDFEIAGAFASAEEALRALPSLSADVVLLDLDLPGKSGIEAIAALRVHAAVIILTAYETEEQIEAALREGARGYLLKGAPLDEIERAIRAIGRGESFLDSRIASRVIALSAGGRARLTEREKEVLRLIAAGRSNKQIATVLKIAERTAKFHVTSIFNKLGVDNRAHAVAVASERGLI
jgi:DNA-binding NarL/FixJ family response regulator